MPFTNYEETSQLATAQLQRAIANERKSNWSEVIFAYKRVLFLISPDNLPADFVQTDRYILVLYEVYYHLGQAYQEVGDHSLALRSFSKAIDILSSSQFGCAIECRSSDSLSVPAYCRRAQSYSILGKYKAAISDLHSATFNDERNMDLLCMEVLTHNTFGEYIKAMRLLVKGLSINKSHIGCRLLRKAMKEEGSSPNYGQQNVEGFDEVTTLHHPEVLDFIQRYLQTFNVPHTVESVELEPPSVMHEQKRRVPSCTHCERKPELSLLVRPRSGDIDYDLSWKRYEMCNILPFKAGELPSKFERDPARERDSYIYKHRRREEYSHSLRAKAQKMKFISQDEFTRMLEDSRSKKRLTEWKIKQQHGMKGSKITLSTLPAISTQMVPRLYPKPWQGDRLKSAPLPQRDSEPIFYPAYS